jgi:hypothetical protein
VAYLRDAQPSAHGERRYYRIDGKSVRSSVAPTECAEAGAALDALPLLVLSPPTHPTTQPPPPAACLPTCLPTDRPTL